MKNLRARANVRCLDIVRRIMSLVFGKSGRTIEYSFVWQHIGSFDRDVLEIGCTGSMLAHKLAKMGYRIHAIDIRTYPFRHKRLNFCRGDARSIPFADDSFDVVYSVSTLEHIGQGEYGDPIDERGDVLTMKEIKRVCKIGGRILITTSYAEKYRNILGVERYYDDVNLHKLVKKLKLKKKEYYTPSKKVWKYTFNWSKTSKENIKRAFLHGSRPIVCLVLQK